MALGHYAEITFILRFIFVIFSLTCITNAQDTDPCTITSIQPATSIATAAIISTYCPNSDELVYSTTYRTTLVALGTKGLTSSIYTVSNVVTGSTPINSAICPPGFTTTVFKCTACAGQPTVTITIPITDAIGTALPSAGTINGGSISPNGRNSSAGFTTSISNNLSSSQGAERQNATNSLANVKPSPIPLSNDGTSFFAGERLFLVIMLWISFFLTL